MPMPDDLADRTEAPTPQRRREARERGDVARTQDLAAAALLLGALFLLNGFGSGCFEAMRALMAEALGQDSMADLDATAAGPDFRSAVLTAGRAAAPVLVGLVAIGVAANV